MCTSSGHTTHAAFCSLHSVPSGQKGATAAEAACCILQSRWSLVFRGSCSISPFRLKNTKKKTPNGSQRFSRYRQKPYLVHIKRALDRLECHNSHDGAAEHLQLRHCAQARSKVLSSLDNRLCDVTVSVRANVAHRGPCRGYKAPAPACMKLISSGDPHSAHTRP